MLKLELVTSRVVNELKIKASRLAPALIAKMTQLMIELQARAQAKTSGRVAASIRNPQAEVSGSIIMGRLTWGGVASEGGGKSYDIAQILEEGAKQHVIYPLTQKGTRAHEKGAKRRFGANVLHFESARLGKDVFADYAFHP